MYRSNNKPYLCQTIVLSMFLCVCLGANAQSDKIEVNSLPPETATTSTTATATATTDEPLVAIESLNQPVQTKESTTELTTESPPMEQAAFAPEPDSLATTPLQSGIASYYGKWFHGRKTANGEIFNMTTLTAAHPTLPFGTLLKVTNTHNNESVVVRVNDRGPYKGQRIIDLSQAAAAKIGMIGRGLATVVLEIFKP